MENTVINFAMYAGFMMIVIAPVFRLFIKAGLPGWKALLPAVNIVRLGNRIDRKIGVLSFFAIIALVFFTIVSGVLSFEGDIGMALEATGLLAILLYSLCMVYVYPMISTTIFFIISFFGSSMGSFPGQLLPVLLVLFAVAVWQFMLDILLWLSIRRHLGQPAWFLVFPLLAPASAFFFAGYVTIVSVINAVNLAGAAGQAGITPQASAAAVQLLTAPEAKIMFAVFLPLLFVGFAYVYYLAYSIKVKYLE